MNLQEIDGSTIVVVTARELRDFAQNLIIEAASKVKTEEEPTYTPSEFAARHHVDKSTLWRWCQAGILKPTRVGRKVLYRDSDLKTQEG